MMYLWSVQMDVTNQVTSWHSVVALLLSPVVECMFSSGPKMHWSVVLLPMIRSWSTLIVLGWVVMTWEVSKTTISVFVLTSMVSPSMALRWLRWRLLAEMAYTTFIVALGGSKAMHEFLVLHYMATDSAEEWDAFLDTRWLEESACPAHVWQVPCGPLS